MDGWRRSLYNHGLIVEDKEWIKFWVKENHCMVKKFFWVWMKMKKYTWKKLKRCLDIRKHSEFLFANSKNKQASDELATSHKTLTLSPTEETPSSRTLPSAARVKRARKQNVCKWHQVARFLQQIAFYLPAQNCESLSEPHLLLQRPFSGACLQQKVTNERLTVRYPLHASFPQHLKVEAISPMPFFVNRAVQINTGCSVTFLEFSVTLWICRKQ